MPKYSNYDKVAGVYDGLSQLVFGNAIRKAQISQLKHIPTNSNILIVGGGTGWILEEISKIHSSGLQITYVDNSFEMIKQAKTRHVLSDQTTFIISPIEDFPVLPLSYDVILTPFFFDNLSQTESEKTFILLDSSLKENGMWLYTDFQLTAKEGYWQKIVLRLMYLFFKITSNVDAKELPKIRPLFSAYTIIQLNSYYKDFIIAITFQKNKTTSI